MEGEPDLPALFKKRSEIQLKVRSNIQRNERGTEEQASPLMLGIIYARFNIAPYFQQKNLVFFISCELNF